VLAAILRDARIEIGCCRFRHDALVALIDKLGPVVVMVHSQSGAYELLASDQRPQLVKAPGQWDVMAFRRQRKSVRFSTLRDRAGLCEEGQVSTRALVRKDVYTMVDLTVAAAAEITTLRQELAAAKARIQEMGDKDNAFKPFA
jgi:hypothetical protein